MPNCFADTAPGERTRDASSQYPHIISVPAEQVRRRDLEITLRSTERADHRRVVLSPERRWRA